MLQATLPEIKLALSSKSRDLLSHVISECMQMRGRIEGVVLNRVHILGFFVLNRVRVSNPQRLTYTQIFVEYPPGNPTTQKVYIMYGRSQIV